MLQALLVALLVGFAIQSMGQVGDPLLRGVWYLQKLVFRILAMVMCWRRSGHSVPSPRSWARPGSTR